MKNIDKLETSYYYYYYSLINIDNEYITAIITAPIAPNYGGGFNLCWQ